MQVNITNIMNPKIDNPTFFFPSLMGQK